VVEGSQRSESGKDACVIWVTVLFSLFLVTLIVFANMGKLDFLVWVMNRIPLGDKAAHFFLIGFLSFLVNRTAMQLLPGQNLKRISIIFTLFLLAIFTLEEISQAPIANRDASLADLLTNYLGIITFALFAYQIRKRSVAALAEESKE
jgi:hypothetical protein